MNINRDYLSNNNTYQNNTPNYIVVHNTDNFNAGANAKAHAKAQHDGNFANMSCHYYVDDGDIVYQAAPHNRGCWHVGVNYGGKLYGLASNRTSVGIEMCVQAGYNYEKAFQNTVALCKILMKELGIPADRVIQHYDACAKNCPSQIRKKGDWARFKKLISEGTSSIPSGNVTTNTEANIDKYYRVRKSWTDSRSQTGAYRSLENAKKSCPAGYTVYDWNGKAVYTSGGSSVPFTVRVSIDDLNIRTGAGTDYAKTGSKTGKGTFTIVEVKTGKGSDTGWGKLKSGAGWISLDYAARV